MAVIKFMVYMTCFCLYQDLVFCDDYGENGNEITLTPSIRGKPEEILWTHNGNKVLEYDGSEVAKYGSFQGRVDVDFETGQLTVRKLNSQDSGKYQSEIWINRKVQIASHTLTVLDALPEPRVTCELDETSNVKKLSCSVESQTQPSYEWSGPDIKESGPTLLVDEQEKKRDSVYTCTVKNKAASRTTDFTLQDCHKVLLAGGGDPAVLVPVIIVSVLLIILLAVLALYFYRRKKQKSRESDRKKMDTENGECDNLLRNVPMETMPGSSDATLPCRTRLTAPKESIANKKWDQDTESENSGDTREGQKLLKESLQSAIPEKNNEDTGSTNEEELDKNEKNSKNADKAEESTNSEPDKKDIKSKKSLQTQEEREKEKSQILTNESENEEKLHEEETETLGDQKTEDKNEDDQTPEDKKEKEEENKEIDSLSTGESNNLLRNVTMEAMPGSFDATLPCRTRLTALKESIADKKWDHDSESENLSETHEGQKLLKESLQSAVPEKNKEDTGSTNEEEQDKHVKNSKNADKAEENANSEPDEKDIKTIESEKSLQTQEEREKEKSQILKNESENEEKLHEEETETLGDQKTEDAGKNEDDQTPEDKKEKEEENKEIDSLNTGESNNLLRNVPMETMSGSSDATLPCHTRLTASKESIAGLENAGETHEGQKLLEESLQSAVPEKNMEDTGNTNEGELNKNEKNSKNADKAEENANSEPDEKDIKTIESKKSLQTQEEREKEKSQILKNESENEEKSHEEETETLGEQKTKDADKNQDDQTPEDKKEENKDIDSLNTGESNNLLRNVTMEAMPDSPANLETEPINISVPSSNQSALINYTDSDKAQTDETATPQPAVTERSTVDTGNVEEQLHTNENNSQNKIGEQSPEQQNKSPCADINEDDQRREEEKAHKGTGRLHTAEPLNLPSHSEAFSYPVDSTANLEKEPTNISVPSSNQSALSDTDSATDSDETQMDINMEEENTSLGVEQKDKENVLPNEELKGGQEQIQEENKHDTESSEPKISITFDNQGKQTTPDSTIHDNSVSQQQYHSDGLNMQGENRCEAVTISSNVIDNQHDNEPIDDDDGEQRDKKTATPQPAVTERSTVDTGNVEEQLHTNENNSQNENAEQSPEQQNKSPCTDINEGEASSDTMDSPANPKKEPINNQEPSNQSAQSNSTDSDETQTDINMEEENTFLGVEQKDKENVLPNEELKGGQEQMQEEIKHDTESSEPKNSIDLDNQGKQTNLDSIIHDNSVCQQQYHNDWLKMQEGGNRCEAVTASSTITDNEQDSELIDDDDGEHRDKSESEQDMKEKDDVPGNNETKDNNQDKTNTSAPDNRTRD